MELTELKERIKNDLKNGLFAVLMCNCIINYEGRAKSFLGEGDRLIIFKRDSSIIVHQPEGVMHINYMKKSILNTRMEDNELVIDARSPDGKEKLIINIKKVYLYESHKLIDKESISLVGDEKEMQEYIYEHPEIISKDFKPLSRESQTRYGFIDILGVENGVFTIVECKRIKAGMPEVEQLHRYVERIKKERKSSVNGVLVAPSITDRAYRYLMEKGYRFVRFSPPGIIKRKKERYRDLTSYY